MIETTIHLNTIQLKNRIVMAPMCMYQSDISGEVKSFHETHYHMHAMGGVGLVIVEATSVLPNGVISQQDLGIWHDNHILGLKRVVSKIHEANAVAGIQINHAGRKARVEDPVGPSAVAYDEASVIPRALTTEEVEDIVGAFKHAAIRANQAGFDVLEIHAAHGYLISQFMSKLSNKRTDKYQYPHVLLNEVLENVYDVWPIHKAITVRISATEYHPDGYDVKDIIALLKQTNLSRVNAIHVSSGGNIKPLTMQVKKGYQLHFAKEIKESISIKTIGGGLLVNKEDGQEALEQGMCDLVFYGRLLLRDPFIFLRTISDIEWPKPYIRGK